MAAIERRRDGGVGGMASTTVLQGEKMGTQYQRNPRDGRHYTSSPAHSLPLTPPKPKLFFIPRRPPFSKLPPTPNLNLGFMDPTCKILLDKAGLSGTASQALAPPSLERLPLHPPSPHSFLFRAPSTANALVPLPIRSFP